MIDRVLQAHATCASRIGVVLALIVAGACGSGESDKEAIVAQVGDLPVSLSELEAYFELNLLTDEVEEMSGEELDRVRSRLLDALVDEKILLIEAERRGFEVTMQEIDRLAGNAEPEPGALPIERRRALARERILVRKLTEDVERHHPPASDAEVSAYLERTTGRLAPSRRLRLRALRLDDETTAQTVYTQIRANKTNFAEAVANHGTGPDQGVPLEMSWNNLSEELRTALGDLQPGEVSQPVPFHGETFLFQLESWLDDPKVQEDDLARRARNELERRRKRQVFEDLLRRLREATPVRIHEPVLPFRYVAEN